jgi:hypothetical protein
VSRRLGYSCLFEQGISLGARFKLLGLCTGFLGQDGQSLFERLGVSRGGGATC